MSTASSVSIANPAPVSESLTRTEVRRFLSLAEVVLQNAAAKAMSRRAMALLEAAIPANQNDPKNQKRERSLTRDMAAYFTRLEDAIPAKAIERLYNSLVAPEE